MIRKAKAVWRGTGRAATGHLSTDFGVLAENPVLFYCPVHMLGTMRLHNASFPSGRTRELCVIFLQQSQP